MGIWLDILAPWWISERYPLVRYYKTSCYVYLCASLCVNRFSFLCIKYLGVKWLGSMVCIGWTCWGTHGHFFNLISLLGLLLLHVLIPLIREGLCTNSMVHLPWGSFTATYIWRHLQQWCTHLLLQIGLLV